MRARLAFLVALALAEALWWPSTRAGAAPPPAPPPPPKSAPAEAPKTAKNPWTALLDEGERAGLSRSRLKATVDRLSREGVAPETARLILAPAMEAPRQGLPWEPVLGKVDEGLLKRVPPETLAVAAKARLDALAKAGGLVTASLGALPAQDKKMLVTASALALESGVPEAVLDDVLKRGKGKPAVQLKAVVEAGEALQLAGFESDAMAGILGDCLARNLRRSEILHVVRFSVEKKRQGMTGAAIRQALWSAPPKGDKASPAEPSRPGTAPGPEGGPEKPAN